MAIDPQKLSIALAKLNIPTEQQVKYSKVAQSLGIIPKKSYKGKETKQLLKEGSQKYKEFVYNDIMKKYQLALDAEAEKAKLEEQKKTKKPKKEKPKPKPTPKLVQKKLVKSMKAKFYNKYNYKYENNETLKDLYKAIKDNLEDGTYVNIAFRDADKNIIYWRSIIASQLESFEEFETEINDITEGKFGSDPIDTNENKIDLNLFSIGSVFLPQTGKSDDLMYESKMIESKEGLCGYLSLLECGFDCETIGVKPSELRDLNKMVSIIKEHNLPITIITNGFTLNKPKNEIITDDRKTNIFIKDKKRDRKYCCAELTEADVSYAVICSPEEETKHYLIYDEVNQHIDYLIGKPKLLRGIYLSLEYKIIKNSKIIFTVKEMIINNRRVEKAPIEYIFFDYETVIDFNNSNCMKSYSVSVLTLDNLTLNELELCDFESRKAEQKEESLERISQIRNKHCKTFLG